MANEREPAGAWSLLAGWTLASLIGWAAGLAAGIVLTLVAGRLPGLNEDRVLAYATLAALGLTTGVAQGVVMRRYLPRPSRWVVATLAGYLLGLAVLAGGNAAGLWSAGLWDDLLLLGFVGAAIGACQWWILRRHYRRAGLWVPATAAGFLCFLWLVADPAHTLSALILRGAILGVLAAVLPGVVLVWLVRQPMPPVSRGVV